MVLRQINIARLMQMDQKLIEAYFPIHDPYQLRGTPKDEAFF